MDITVYDPKKKKIVKAGAVNLKKKIFGKEVTSKHFMRISQSYGIQNNAFLQILELGVIHIAIKEKETGDILMSKTEDWVEHTSVQDYGHGKQRFLPIKYMKRKKGKL